MKKNLLVISLIGVLGLNFSGCSNKNSIEPNNISSKSGIVIDNGKTIAYAHMKGGTKLIKISSSSVPENEDVEIIQITKKGFYPNYKIDTTSEDRRCGRHYSNKILHDWSKTDFCKSNYTTANGSQAVGNVLFNSIFIPLAVITNPVNTASGNALYHLAKTFSVTSFSSAIKENNLEKYQAILSELDEYAEIKNSNLRSLYEIAFKKYINNIKLVSINYTVNDKSGLANDLNIKGDYKAEEALINNRQYTYNTIPSKELMDSNTTVDYFKRMIDAQYEKDILEYKGYLTQSFKTYKLVGSPKSTLKYNENISLDITVNAPEYIEYIEDKQMTVSIPLIVEKVHLKNMIPKKFILDDASFRIIMNTNITSITAIATNKTRSFLTLKSLTGYYKDSLLNQFNIDKELSPEAESLPENSNYTLISAEMRDKSNFEDMTKAKAQNIKINFGYAVKYKINNTNIEKSIYDTKQFSLYDIYKQYK